jgi:hypothetical protein
LPARSKCRSRSIASPPSHPFAAGDCVDPPREVESRPARRSHAPRPRREGKRPKRPMQRHLAAPPPARDERSNPIARWVRRPSIPIFHSAREARKGGLIFVAVHVDP